MGFARTLEVVFRSLQSEMSFSDTSFMASALKGLVFRTQMPDNIRILYLGALLTNSPVSCERPEIVSSRRNVLWTPESDGH